MVFPSECISRLAEAIRCEARGSENIAEQTREALGGGWVMIARDVGETREEKREKRWKRKKKGGKMRENEG